MNILGAPEPMVPEPDDLYQPLQGQKPFRLLNLAPATDASSPLDCILSEFELGGHDAPKYTALSYTWGNDIANHIITINGKPFRIRKNLFLALQHLRKRSELQMWWIDAICINQDDVAERNTQVACMREIFSSAIHVLAWLGPEADDSNRAMWFLRTFCLLQPAAMNYALSHDSKAEKALEQLMLRPYWVRAWIMQEIIVAKDILLVCGGHSAPWATIYRFMTYAQGGAGNTRTKLISLKNGQEDNNLFLKRLINASRTALATEPKDKVYAILGLVQKGHGLTIQPDYQLSPCAIYLEATQAMYQDEPEQNRTQVDKYIQEQTTHNMSRQTGQENDECDGIECGSRDACFSLPYVLGESSWVGHFYNGRWSRNWLHTKTASSRERSLKIVVQAVRLRVVQHFQTMLFDLEQNRSGEKKR